MATFTVTTNSYVNLPPSQVGNGSGTTNYGTPYTFTVASFTTLTTPPYADPEGDAAQRLKITSLPAIGTLKLNGVDVTLNQIINFTDIALGLFKYIPDNGTYTEVIEGFTFEISDAGGGGIFVG